MREETKRLIKDTIYGYSGAFAGSIIGSEVASRSVPEYIVRYFSDNGDNTLRQIASKISEITIEIQRNPNYDNICFGAAAACGVAGCLLGVWGLRKVEKHIINKINERFKTVMYFNESFPCSLEQ